MIRNYLFSCDWGTSSFRLRLVDVRDYAIIGEIVSNEGISSTYNAWKSKGKHNDADRHYFFRDQLQRQIQLLSEKLALDLQGIPIVISGMASSSIGMEETLYAELPFATDGSQANFRYYAFRESFPHYIILISGVKGEQDVMRGEETELIGLLSLLADSGEQIDCARLIFPGTHSKHLDVQGGQLIDFRTYMTGEVFKVMASHSILQDSVDIQDMSALSESKVKAFRSGVREAVSSSILNKLFSVRINQLFQKLDKAENAFYLSGLLIGSELKDISLQQDRKLILCSGSHLFELYKLAMDELQLLEHTLLIPADVIDRAAIAGQLKIFQNLKNLSL